jgi:hypothetical protein
MGSEGAERFGLLFWALTEEWKVIILPNQKLSFTGPRHFQIKGPRDKGIKSLRFQEARRRIKIPISEILPGSKNPIQRGGIVYV